MSLITMHVVKAVPGSSSLDGDFVIDSPVTGEAEILASLTDGDKGEIAYRFGFGSYPSLKMPSDIFFQCRASDGIGKDGLRSYLMGYGRGGPHGKVSPALQPAAESGHLTRAFDRASAHFGALREVSHTPDAFLPVAEDLL